MPLKIQAGSHAKSAAASHPQSYGDRIRAVTWDSRQALAVFFVPWIIIPFLIVFAAAFLEPHFALAHQFLDAIQSSSVHVNFGLVILDAVGSYALIAYYLRRTGGRWTDLGLRRFNLLKVILYVVALFISLLILVVAADWLIQVIFPNYNPNQAQTTEFDNVAPNLQIYSLIALVFLPPLVEETVFRGFIFPAFSKRFGLIAGALLSSLLFGFAHLQVNVSVYTFLLGLLLCWLYTKTGSIIPGMLLHMLNNFIAYSAGK